MPMRCVSGSCSTSRIRSMQYARRDLPILARCERPSDSVASFSGAYPGGLAQGPEEKCGRAGLRAGTRSEEHTSELQSLLRISYAVFCLKKKITQIQLHTLNGRNTWKYKHKHNR